MPLLQTNYIDKKSIIHSLDPMVKFSWIILVLTIFLSSGSMTLFIITDLVLFLAAILGKIGKDFLKGMLFMIGPIFLFALIIHGLFNPLGTGGGEFFSFLSIRVSEQGIMNGLFWGFKITSLISVFYIFILTTYPGRTVISLKSFGMPHKMGFLINSTLQTVPLMLMEAETIIDAQRARGLETSGKILNRLKAYIPLVGPIVLGSVMKVYERTIALEVRGFSSKAKKTSFYVDNPRLSDKILVGISFGLLAIYIVGRVLGWIS